MLDEKKINDTKRRVTNFIKEGIIKKEKEKRFVEFFLDNAKNSLDSAKLLFEVSTKNSLKNSLGFVDFNGFLWVINSSYYSMFYMARALLENEGIKIKTDLSIHAVTFDSLVYYFYLTGKLQKKFIEDFAEAKEEVSEILGKEKAKELIEDYFYEKKKRATFTYPDKTTKQISLPSSIKAEQIGTYEIEVTANKEGYRTITTKEQFGVIKEAVSISYSEPRDETVEETSPTGTISPSPTTSPPEGKEKNNIALYIFLAGLLILIIIVALILVKKLRRES